MLVFLFGLLCESIQNIHTSNYLSYILCRPARVGQIHLQDAIPTNARPLITHRDARWPKPSQTMPPISPMPQPFSCILCIPGERACATQEHDPGTTWAALSGQPIINANPPGNAVHWIHRGGRLGGWLATAALRLFCCGALRCAEKRDGVVELSAHVRTSRCRMTQ